MAIEITYKFRTTLEARGLSKSFMGVSHEGWIQKPVVKSSTSTSITLSKFSFFCAGREAISERDDFSADQRLFHVISTADFEIPNLSSDGMSKSVVLGFRYPFSPASILQTSEESFFVPLTADQLPTFGGLVLGRLLYANHTWHLYTDCVDFADKYYVDNKLEGFRVSLMPLREGHPYCNFSVSHFVIRHYNEVVESHKLLLPHSSGDIVPVELDTFNEPDPLKPSPGFYGVDLVGYSSPQPPAVLHPLNGHFYALGYKSVVSNKDLVGGVYRVKFSVLGSGISLAKALEACVDPVSRGFNAPMAVVQWFSEDKESVITQFSSSSVSSSGAGSVLRFITESASSSHIKEINQLEPPKNSLLIVTFPTGNSAPNFCFKFVSISSVETESGTTTSTFESEERPVSFNTFLGGGSSTRSPGIYVPNSTVLFFFDGSKYEQITVFLNRMVVVNDNATGSITDTGGNLSIPLPVIVEVPSASLTQITANPTAPRTLKETLKILIDNIAYLFANKQNNLNRTIAVDDTVIGDITDIGGDLVNEKAIPLRVTTTVGSSNPNQLSAGSPHSLRTVIQRILDNLANLFLRLATAEVSVDTNARAISGNQAAISNLSALLGTAESGIANNKNDLSRVVNLNQGSGNLMWEGSWYFSDGTLGRVYPYEK